jgi:hypothetical protein
MQHRDLKRCLGDLASETASTEWNLNAFGALSDLRQKKKRKLRVTRSSETR